MKIYHVCRRADWEQQISEDYFEVASLSVEGFIHCSYEHQVAGVLQRYYQGQTNLLCLLIDGEKLEHTLKVELASNGDYFPHIYGKINKSAVVEIQEIA